MPLCTMSQWGWHTTPHSADVDPKNLRLTNYDTHGRMVGYHTSSEGQTELFNWLRENPHRLHLGQIGFLLAKGDARANASDISDVTQELDLWSGTLHSRFTFSGEEVSVKTAVHPDYDLLAVEIFPRPIAAAALGFTVLGDSFAALVGKAWGRHRFFGKTFEGTAAGLIACLLWSWFLVATGFLTWPVALAGALVASLVEMLPIPLDDNLGITLFSGYVMKLLGGTP